MGSVRLPDGTSMDGDPAEEEGKATLDHGRSFNGPARRGLPSSSNFLSFIGNLWQGY
jgi:hypothetical protein